MNVLCSFNLIVAETNFSDLFFIQHAFNPNLLYYRWISLYLVLIFLQNF